MLCLQNSTLYSSSDKQSKNEIMTFCSKKILFSCLFQSGVVGGVMQVLLLSMSAHITKQLGMAPGGEFRAAYNEVS